MRYRIHYPDESIYVGPSPASGHHFSIDGTGVSTDDLATVTGEVGNSSIQSDDITNLVKNVYRTQSYSYNINQNIQPIGSYGMMGTVGYLRNSVSDINFGFDYLINNFQNEYNFGLTVNSDKSILSDIFTSGKDGLNFFIKTTPEGQESLHDISNTNADTIGFGNCFLNSYSFEYEVNSLPLASVSFSCDNLIYVNTITGIQNPAIDPETDTRYNNFLSLPSGKLYEYTGSDYQVSVVRNGDLTLSFQESEYQGKRLSNQDPSGSYSFLGQKIQDATIQSFSVSMDLNRDRVSQLGSKISKNRSIIPPVYANISVSAICNEYNTGDYLDSLEENRIYKIELSSKMPSCNPNSRNTLLKYLFNNCYLNNKSYSLSIGTNKNVNLNFIAPVYDASNPYYGFRLSGAFVPHTDNPLSSRESEEIQDTGFNSLAADTFNYYETGYYQTGLLNPTLNEGTGFFKGWSILKHLSGEQVWFDAEDYDVQSIPTNTLSIQRSYNDSISILPVPYGISGDETFDSYSALSGFDITGQLSAGDFWTGTWSFLDNPTGSY